MGHHLSATTNSMRQSEPPAIAALRGRREGGKRDAFEENSIIASLR